MSAESLSTRLRQHTQEAHRAAERAGVMGLLLQRALPRAGYAVLLTNLLPIYEALETALAASSTPARVRALLLPGIARGAALRADLRALQPPPAAGSGTGVAGEALAYAARLAELQRRDPVRLAAHAYLRYLGDLNGGQVLQRLLRATWGEAVPTAFYVFEDGGDAAARARIGAAFRARLDGVAADDSEADAVLDEALTGFERHRRLFTALAPPSNLRPSIAAAPRT